MSTNSSHVDERVVQMEFDNKQFEQNVSQTMTTLDKLKAKLKFDDSAKDFKALEKASSGVNFENLASTLNTINDRFSTFGIVGMTVMQRLTNAAIDLGKHLLSAINAPFNQIKTGGWNRALNIENAMFKMAGLLQEEFEQNRELIDKNIDYAVSGTAYSYDAAASAMAQLLASGVDFKKMNEDGVTNMQQALRAISGVAAMTNSEYSEIAHIFTTVAGNGRLMTEQLNQIAGRGINAAATLADKLHVSESELRDMVSKGQIDFQTFATAMDKAFGEHAKKANETFTGALSNIKAALSRTGQGFATSLQTYGRDILNAIRPNINNLNKKYLGPLVEDFDSIMSYLAAKAKSIFGDGNEGILYLGWVPRAIRTIENVVLGLVGILEQLKKAFSEIFPKKTRDDVLMFWVRIERATDKFRKAFSDTTSVVDKFKSKAEELTKPVTDAAETLEKTVHTAEELQEITKRVISGEFGNGETRFKALEELGYNWKEVQNSVNEALGCSYRYDIEQDSIAEGSERLSQIDEQRAGFLYKMEDAQANVSDEVKGQDNMLGRMSGKMSLLEMQEQRFGREIVNAAKEQEKQLSDEERAREKRLNNIKSTFRGIAAALKIVGQAGAAFKKVIIDPLTSKVIPKALDQVLNFTGRLGEKLVSLSVWLEKTGFFEQFFQGLVDIFLMLVKAVQSVINKVVELYHWFTNLTIVQFIVGAIGQFFLDLPGNVEKAKNKVKEFGEAIRNMPGVQLLLTNLSNLLTTIREFASRKSSKFLEFIKNFNESGYGAMVVGGFLWVVNKVAEKLGEIVEKLKDAYLAAKDFVSPFVGKASDAIKNFFNFDGKNGINFDELKKRFENVGGLFGIIKNFAGSIGELFLKAFHAIPWDRIGSIVAKGIGLAFLVQFFTILTGIGKIINKVAGLLGGANTALGKFNGVLQQYINGMKADNLMTVAKAIAVFTGCIAGLALLPKDGLFNAAAAIISVTLAIKYLMDGLFKVGVIKDQPIITNVMDILKLALTKFLKMAGIAVVAIGVAASVFIVVMTIKYIVDNIIGIDAKTALRTIIVLIAVFFSLAAATYILVGIADDFQTFNKGMGAGFMIGFAAMLVGLGAALYLIGSSISKFQNADWGAIGKVGLVLAALLTGLALVAATSSKGSPIKAALLIIAIAFAINAMLIPISAISKEAQKTGPKGIWTAAKLIGGFMALVAVMMFAFSKIKASTFLSLGGAFIAIAGGIYIIVKALELLSAIKFDEQTLGVLKNLAIGMGILMGVMALMSLIGKTEVGMGMFLIGTAFLEISVGALALAAALFVLGKALPVVAQGLADFGLLLQERSKDILVGVLAIIGVIVTAIVMSEGGFASAGASLIKAFVKGLGKAWPTVISFLQNNGVLGVVALITALLAAAELLIPTVVDRIIDILVTLANTLQQRKRDIADAFTKVVVSVIEILIEVALNALGVLGDIILGGIQKLNEWAGISDPDALFHTNPEDWDSFRKTATGVMDDTYDHITSTVEEGNERLTRETAKGARQATAAVEENYNPSQKVAEENAAMQQTVASQQSVFGQANADMGASGTGGFMGSFDLTGIVGGNMDGVMSMIAQSNPQFAALMGNYASSGNAGFSLFNPSGTVDEELMHRVPETIRQAAATDKYAYMEYLDYMTDDAAANARINAQENANEIGSSFMDGLEEYDYSTANIDLSGMYTASYDDAYAAGSEAPQGYAQGAIDNVTAIQDAGSEMANTLVSATDSAKTELQQSGSQGALGFARGMSTMVSRVKSEGQRLKSNAVNGTNGVYDSMYTQGSNAGEGFYDGMRSWIQRIADKAYEMGDKAVDSAKRGIDSNSPSKKTRKLGVYFDQGFILGMQDLSGHVEDAASNVATAALDSMRTAVGKIGTILSSDLDYEPTIRPVMDLSDVETGAQLINDALANTRGYIPVSALGSTARIAGQFSASGSGLPGEDVTNSGNTYTFTQNNYSPRALSRLEIYRQTKNQFAQMKGLTANG